MWDAVHGAIPAVCHLCLLGDTGRWERRRVHGRGIQCEWQGRRRAEGAVVFRRPDSTLRVHVGNEGWRCFVELVFQSV